MQETKQGSNIFVKLQMEEQCVGNCTKAIISVHVLNFLHVAKSRPSSEMQVELAKGSLNIFTNFRRIKQVQMSCLDSEFLAMLSLCIYSLQIIMLCVSIYYNFNQETDSPTNI